jgi:hypothetical protein
MISEGRIDHIEAAFRRSRRCYRVSSAALALSPIFLIYGLYEIILYALTLNPEALHIALTSLLLVFLIQASGRLILIPHWKKTLEEVTSELEKAEAEIENLDAD